MTTNGQDENVENGVTGDSPVCTNDSASEKPGTSSSIASGGTGPRTQQQRKDRTRYNALKQGILAKVIVLKGESRTEFDALLNGLRDYFHPEGGFEQVQIEKLATLFWRERRLIIADGQLDIRKNSSFEIALLGRLRQSDLLLRYETTLNRNIDRVLNQLERHQSKDAPWSAGSAPYQRECFTSIAIGVTLIVCPGHFHQGRVVAKRSGDWGTKNCKTNSSKLFQ